MSDVTNTNDTDEKKPVFSPAQMSAASVAAYSAELRAAAEAALKGEPEEECEECVESDAEEVEPLEVEPEEELTPEEIAEREAAEAEAAAQAAAEKAAREAEESAARKAADDAAREARAQVAVETLSQGAGFNSQYGVYYDATHGVVKATSTKADRAVSAPGDTDVEGETIDVTDVAQMAELEAEELADELQMAEAEAGYVDPVVFGRQVAKVTQAVTRNPLQRELFYKVLDYCQESRGLRDVEQFVMAQPAFKRTATNAFHFIKIMETAGGLERFELDEEGDVVTDERKKGLTEDEIDDLVAEYAFMTTPAGQAVVEQHTPQARILELLRLSPDRKDTYIEVMQFLSEEPRTYNEVSDLLKGRDVLWHLDSKGNPEQMQPSVFVDKLNSAAAIEWNGGWVLTEAGRAYLDELKEM